MGTFQDQLAFSMSWKMQTPLILSPRAMLETILLPNLNNPLNDIAVLQDNTNITTKSSGIGQVMTVGYCKSGEFYARVKERKAELNMRRIICTRL